MVAEYTVCHSFSLPVHSCSLLREKIHSLGPPGASRHLIAFLLWHMMFLSARHSNSTVEATSPNEWNQSHSFRRPVKGINLPQCGIDRFTLLLPAASTQYKDSWQSTHDRLTQVLLGNHGKTYVLQIRDVITHYFTINYIHALGYSMVYTNTGTCILETNKIKCQQLVSKWSVLRSFTSH